MPRLCILDNIIAILLLLISHIAQIYVIDHISFPTDIFIFSFMI